MTPEEQLKNLILDKYGSALAFTTQLGIPNSTLDSVFRRGVNKSSITVMITICNALHISLEELTQGRIVYTNTRTLEELIQNIKSAVVTGAVTLRGELITPQRAAEIIETLDDIIQ